MLRSMSIFCKSLTHSRVYRSHHLPSRIFSGHIYDEQTIFRGFLDTRRTLSTTSRNDGIAVDRISPSKIRIVQKPKEKTKIPYPRDIVTYLDQFVIGQELAKRTLAVGVYQHYKRVEYNKQLSCASEEILAANEELIIDSKKISCKHKKSFLKKLMSLLEDIGKEDATLGKVQKFIIQAAQEVSDQKKPKKVEPEDFERRLGLNSNVKEDDMALDKSNILILGPSGSGKTYLTQKLAEALDVPIAMCDCTTLTEAGYVGDSVESVLEKLLRASDGNAEKTQRGIVFLDEFDKIYTAGDRVQKTDSRDVGGRGVQQALLKLIEGCRVKVTNPFNTFSKFEIDTTNILFIASGAFSDIERVVAKRLDKRSVGFSSNSIRLSEDLDATDDKLAMESKIQLLSETDHGDLISFGMVPELVGRFPVLVPFHPLSEEMLRQVMTKPKNNIISQSKKLFQMDNIELEFTDCAVSEIAKLAIKRKTGARAIRSIMEKVLLNVKFECPGTVEGKILINGEIVGGEKEYKNKTGKKTSKKVKHL